MILFTSIVGAIVIFATVYVLIRRYQKTHSLQADVSRRLQKFKDDTAKQSAKLQARKVVVALSDIPFMERTFKPLLQSIQAKLLSFAPTDISAMLEERIMRAGKTGIWTVNQCVLAWVISIIVCALIALIIVNNYDLFLIQKILLMFVGGIVGGILPFMFLNNFVDKRRKQILKQMPEFLDLLCVSVQAGLSFEGAVSKIIARMKGPLTDEFKQMQRDGQMGMARRIALQSMAKRCDIEEVYLFTASIIQSERLGTSLAKTLEMQAENMRDRHRQHVKAQALKAPVKIIFPIVIFILPAIFIILLLPILYTTLQNINM